MRVSLALPFLISCSHVQKAPPSAGLYFRASRPINTAAIRRADEVTGQMFSRAPALLKKLKDEPYAINVIAIDQKVTDVPGLESLRGEKFDDQRTFDEMRGMAWKTDSFIPEENLLCLDQNQTRENILVHEVAHSLQYFLDEAMAADIRTAFENARYKKLYPEGSYMLKNEWEYFAVGSSIYFGTTYRWDIVGDIRNRIDLEDTDPKLAKVMKQVYAGAEVTPSSGCLY